jgi:hypothetical protein
MIITSSSLAVIYNVSKTAAQKRLYRIKTALGLLEHQELSVGKFCEHTGLPTNEVELKLGYKK